MLKRYRDAAVVLIALAIPFWFLRFSMQNDRRYSETPADGVMIQIVTPIQYAAATLARNLGGLVSDYVYLVDVKEDNASLAAQKARLEARLRKLEGLEAENRRLRGLLGLRNHLKADVVSAEVIAKDTSEFFRVAHVSIDRPPAKEIKSDARLPVITLDGVVGTTATVAGSTVEVQLVVDAGFAVDVVVERTGARGFVRGSGSEAEYRCRVEYVKRTDEVEVGDLLVTSGWGRRFPPGVPVARVAQVIRRDFGIYQTVLAEPTVDFSRLREVLIVMSHSGNEAPPVADGEKTSQR